MFPTAIRRGAILGATFLAGLTGVSLSQGPDQQAALAALHDSLQAATTIESLQMIAPTWNGDVPGVMKQIRKAHLRLRRGEILGDQNLFDKALHQFEWASGTAKDWPYPWYGMALSLLGMKRFGFENRGVTSKEMADYTRFYLGGERALRQSWLIDSTFNPTTDLLTEIMYLEGDRLQQPWRVRALEARRRTARRADPRIELILGRTYRMRGDLSDAELAFERYEAVGGNRSVAALELARTLAGQGDDDAAEAAYYAGLIETDSLARAFYRTDLSWITTFDELGEFDAVPVDSLQPWVKSFWRRRAANAVQAPGERLREHLRRWHVTNQAFRVSRPWQRAWLNPPLVQEVGACTLREPKTIDQLEFPNPTRPKDLRSLEPMLDHRAVIYMRHGKPAQRIWWAGNPTEEDLLYSYPMVIRGTVTTDLEGWFYWIDGEPRVFHFTSHQATGFGTSLNTAFLPIDYFRALARVEGHFNKAAAAQAQSIWLGIDNVSTVIPYRCQRRVGRIAEQIGQDMKVGVETESYALLFPHALDPTVQAFGLPATDGVDDGTVLVVFAVPLERLGVDSLPSGTRRASLRFRLSAIDTVSNAIVWIDSTRTFNWDGLADPATKLTGVMEMPAPAGSFGIRVAIQSPDSLVGSAVILPNTVSVWGRSDSLRVSDLVTGREDANLSWMYAGHVVVLNPLNTYYPAGTATVFYVADGLVPGNAYRTTITLQPWGDDEDIISLSFEETAAAPREYHRRDIVLTDLEAGRYRVRLTVLDVTSGRTVVREQVINLLDRAR